MTSPKNSFSLNSGARAGTRSRSKLPSARLILTTLFVGLAGTLSAAPETPAAAIAPNLPPTRGLEEVDSAQVHLQGGFWGPRLKVHQAVTIPHGLDSLEKDGHVTNFDKAAGVFDGPLKGHHAFDSDLYKALEGAVISLQNSDDKALRLRVNGILDRILAAQQKDGFLITYWIINGLDKKWDNLRLEHQMYNAGHLFEMAVEHHQLTGETKALDAAKRFADHIGSVFGPNKLYDVDGHEEVELALVRLYRATGERRYLDLSRFFLDERGYAHGTERKPFDPASVPKLVKPEGKLTDAQRREFWMSELKTRNGRMQDHKPVIDQFEAVGHAVRAGYLYSAMADMVRFSEAPGYENALDHLWDDVVGRKMYVTGNIGSGQHGDEGFGDPYLLPNDSAYCESCAAIAHVYWQHRMNLLKGLSKYADVMEMALYNGVLSGISLSGDKFFYENPLSSQDSQRRPWISLSCCPTNLMRIIPEVGGLAYAHSKGKVYVNLYAAGEAKLTTDEGVALTLAQQTEYPWEGNVRLTLTPEKPSEFTLYLRVPGWALGRPVPSDLYSFTDAKAAAVTLKVNGEAAEATPGTDGYIHLQRSWKAGDVVELNMPMSVQRVHANEKVQADKGKIALMRGPILYCLESVDHAGVDMAKVVLPADSVLKAEHRADLLGGVTVIQGEAQGEGKSPVALTAVPYYAWQNRGVSRMNVWIQEQPAQ